MSGCAEKVKINGHGFASSSGMRFRPDNELNHLLVNTELEGWTLSSGSCEDRCFGTLVFLNHGAEGCPSKDHQLEFGLLFCGDRPWSSAARLDRHERQGPLSTREAERAQWVCLASEWEVDGF